MESVVELRCGSFLLTMLNDPCHTFGSVDNVRRYDHEFSFNEEQRNSSRHGLICREADGTEHSCILQAGGGASGVHDYSAIVVKNCCIVAVGDMACSLSLPKLDLNWATRVDGATCFGVYYSPKHDCLLSHGEMEIARLNLQGEIVWSVGGRDIFTEGFRLFDDHAEAIDFYQQAYRIDIITGRSKTI